MTTIFHNNKAQFAYSRTFWDYGLPQYIKSMGDEDIHEVFHKDIEDYLSFRTKKNIEIKENKSEEDYERDLMIYHETLLHLLNDEDAPFHFGDKDAVRDFGLDAADFVERSFETDNHLVYSTYKILLENLRPGQLRVAFLAYNLTAIEELLAEINGSAKYKMCISDQYNLIVSNAPVPIYGHIRGHLSSGHQIRHDCSQKVYFVECVSKKAQLRAVLDIIESQHAPHTSTEYGKCCICKEGLNTPFGNNPNPVRKRGKCCSKCNYTKVIPARLTGNCSDISLSWDWELKILQTKLMEIIKIYPSPELYHEQVAEDLAIHTIHHRWITLAKKYGATAELNFEKKSIAYIMDCAECAAE